MLRCISIPSGGRVGTTIPLNYIDTYDSEINVFAMRKRLKRSAGDIWSLTAK